LDHADNIQIRDFRDRPLAPQRNKFTSNIPFNLPALAFAGQLVRHESLRDCRKCVFLLSDHSRPRLLLRDARINAAFYELPPFGSLLSGFVQTDNWIFAERTIAGVLAARVASFEDEGLYTLVPHAHAQPRNH